MTIYAEYLFLENFIAGLGILKLTALMCGRYLGKLRLIAGAGMCGIFSFIILLNLSGFMTFFYEILFVLAVMAASFAPVSMKVLIRIGAVFYCISFLLGGSAVAVIWLSGAGGAVNNGFFYIGAGGYLLVLAGGVVGVMMLMSVMKFVKQRSEQAPKTVKLSIDLMGKTLECTGKVDSANFLKDPLSGKPVSLISAKKAEECWGDILKNDMWKNRVRAVPYKSVGCESGVIMAVQCDSLTIDRGDIFGRHKIYMRNVFMGLYDGDFSAGKEEEPFSVLLQPEVMCEGSAVR